jgi:predicted GIY-YIG superfamily endonuclease
MSELVWHQTIGGNSEDAVKYGLTLRAKCGVVWVPTILGGRNEYPDVGECPNCYPVRPGYVYRCYDSDDRLIYVGCSVAPKSRLDQHRKSSWWFEQVARVRYTVYSDKDYALRKESEAIATENPRWNVRGRDRGLWTADDYRDAHRALQETGGTSSRVQKLRSEAYRRFQVDLEVEEAERSA